MKVSFSKRTSSLDKGAREDIRSRIYFALSRFSPRIEQLTVQITEVGQASGSSQWLCRLSVRMKRLGSFSVESVDDEAANAVSSAADRAAKQAERILKHRHELNGNHAVVDGIGEAVEWILGAQTKGAQ